MKKKPYQIAEVTSPFVENAEYKNLTWEPMIKSVLKAFRNAFPKAVRLNPSFDDGEAARIVHTTDYVDFILEGARLDPDYNPFPLYFVARKETIFTQPTSFEGKHTLYFFDEVTRATPTACQGAILSAAAAKQAAEWVLAAPLRTALVSCRPPGHHAFPSFGGGVCIFANPSITASTLKQHGRVAIIDVDQDHGNGSQAIFYEDPEVLTISLHAAGWPFVAGFAEETGRSLGKGTNMNLPLPRGTKSKEYLEAFERALYRIKEFAPSYLVIALGFDAHKDQGFGWLQLESEDFGLISSQLAELRLPTVITMEGCYNYSSTGEAAEFFFNSWASTYGK